MADREVAGVEPCPPLVLGDPSVGGPLILTCEHSSNRIPEELRVTDSDRPWLDTHWAWDKGAPDVVRTLTEETGSCAVLATSSRLVCDPNRVVNHPQWIREEMEGYSLTFNQDLGTEERERRRLRYYEPYHVHANRLVEERVAAGGAPLLLAIHSFTPHYETEDRWMHMGVIFDTHEELALRLKELLGQEGFDTALNQPYSGALGQMYSPRRHGRSHDLPYLELEMRQDLFSTPERASRAVAAVCRAVRTLAGLPGALKRA